MVGLWCRRKCSVAQLSSRKKKRLAAMTAGAALSEEEKAAIQRRRADSAARVSAEVKTNDELQAKLARRRAASESEDVPGSQGMKEEPHGGELDGNSSELQAKLARRRAASESDEAADLHKSDREHRQGQGGGGSELQGKLARRRAASESEDTSDQQASDSKQPQDNGNADSAGELSAKLARRRVMSDSEASSDQHGADKQRPSVAIDADNELQAKLARHRAASESPENSKQREPGSEKSEGSGVDEIQARAGSSSESAASERPGEKKGCAADKELQAKLARLQLLSEPTEELEAVDSNVHQTQDVAGAEPGANAGLSFSERPDARQSDSDAAPAVAQDGPCQPGTHVDPRAATDIASPTVPDNLADVLDALQMASPDEFDALQMALPERRAAVDASPFSVAMSSEQDCTETPVDAALPQVKSGIIATTAVQSAAERAQGHRGVEPDKKKWERPKIGSVATPSRAMQANSLASPQIEGGARDDCGVQVVTECNLKDKQPHCCCTVQ